MHGNSGDKFCKNCGGTVTEKTSVLFCKNCGSSLSHNSAFCANCGAQCHTPSPHGFNTPPMPDGKKSNRKLWIIIASVILALALIVAAIFILTGAGDNNDSTPTPIVAATPEPTPDATPTPTPTPTPEPTPKPTPEPTTTPAPEFNMLELRSNARWLFEQTFLPSVVYEFNEVIIEYINNYDEEGMEDFMLWAWSYLVSLYIGIEMNDFTIDETQLGTLGLGDDHITEVTIERISDDVVAAIVEMFDIGEERRSTYIAIVYTDDSNLRIFTIEQSFLSSYMFCYVGTNSRGSFFTIENNRDAFIEAIIEVIESQMDVSAGIVWSN